MENLARLKGFWKNKNVLITGHTGFKGAWLLLYLNFLGANIYACSLRPNTAPNFYDKIKRRISFNSKFIDINNFNSLSNFISSTNVNIAFHLAAQPLVSESYKNTLYTYSTNVIGTANLFEILKKKSSIKAIINVTSDKCYFNNENKKFFKEDDKLCGMDPYSNSKSCSELLSYSYYNSFFKNKNIGLATARAGNVIGGGDWSKNRIITDLMNHYFYKKKLIIRNPDSVRPWQYVLELIKGYIVLAENLYKSPKKYSKGWNFAPNKKNHIPVKDLLKNFNQKQKISKIITKPNVFSESKTLLLDNKFTKKNLGWTNKMNIKQLVDETYNWYECYYNNRDIYKYSCDLIYRSALDDD